jgi:hypothetical protein
MFFRSGTKFTDDLELPVGNVAVFRHQPNVRQGFILAFSAGKIQIYRASDENKVATVVTPYRDEDIPNLRIEPLVDTLFITDGYNPLATLARQTDTAWTYGTPETKDGPFLAQTDEEKLVTLQVTSQDYALRLENTGAFGSAVIGEHIEYLENNIRFLGEVLSTPNADEVTIRPVDFITTDLATNAVFFVDDSNSRVLCNKLTFTQAMKNTYARFIDSEDSNTVKWVLLGDMIGVLDGSATNWNHDQDADSIPDDADAIELALSPLPFITAPADTKISVAVNTGTISSNTASTFDASTDTGRQLRIIVENTPVWGTITAVTSDQEVDIAFEAVVPRDPALNTFTNNGRTDIWQFGAFYNNVQPIAVTFHQQRLVLAGTTESPESFWLSEPNKFFTFALTDENNQILDSSGIGRQLTGAQENIIRWVKGGRVLTIGTEGAEWAVFSGAQTGAFSPLTLRAEKQSENGTIIPPAELGGIMVFYQASGRKLREFEFSDETGRFDTNDVSILSEHMRRNNAYAISLDRMKEPYPIFLTATSNGDLLMTTYIGNQGVSGWTRHKIGGGGKVLGMQSVRHTGITAEQIYMAVERTIGGETKRYLERLEIEFFPEDPQDKNEMFFVDSYKYVDIPTPVNFRDMVGGFDHLIGETVVPVVNGSVEPEQVVTAEGEIQIDKEVTLGDTVRVLVGYKYRGIYQSLPTEFPSREGNIQGKIKRIHKLTIHFLNTLGISIGPDLESIELKSFRETEGQMDNSPPFFTGYKEFELDQSYERAADFFLVQDQPYPCTITQINPEAESYK